jgi:hypothetical protein
MSKAIQKTVMAPIYPAPSKTKNRSENNHFEEKQPHLKSCCCRQRFQQRQKKQQSFWLEQERKDEQQLKQRAKAKILAIHWKISTLYGFLADMTKTKNHDLAIVL